MTLRVVTTAPDDSVSRPTIFARLAEVRPRSAFDRIRRLEDFMKPQLFRKLIGISTLLIGFGLATNGNARVVFVAIGIGCLWFPLAIHGLRIRLNHAMNESK